jgi:hypothetical protein
VVVSPGEATRPATDTISLDQVFGDEGFRSSGAAPQATPPALSPAPQDTGGFSFDQFFSPTEPPAGAGEVAPATPEPPARSSGGRLRPPLEDEGDLDQFQAWLRGLKS